MQGLIALGLAYVLSQFFRSFLAVLTPALKRDLGLDDADLAAAGGAWFLAFALMQIPVGEALDRLGPRRTTAGLLAFGGAGGTGLLAAATAPGEVVVAMVLIGAGCAPVLMAAYLLLARDFPASRFAMLAAGFLGIGSLGNIAGAAPFAAAVTGFGWRETLTVAALLTLLVAAALLRLIRDPPRTTTRLPGGGSALHLLARRELWPVFAMMAACYAPVAGIRGLWSGPWLAEVYGMDITGIGAATFWMALAMIAGSFAYGPLDSMLGTRKWVILPGNLVTAAICAALALMPADQPGLAVLTLATLGFFGATYPLVIAHGRSFLAPQEIGRGVTLLNFFGIGMAGLMQVLTGLLPGGTDLPAGPDRFTGIFLAYAGLVLLCAAAYGFARDRTD